MRDMKEKFGAQVESFRYAFVIPAHIPGWDQPLPESAARPFLPAAGSGSSAAGKSSPGGSPAKKAPTYIEVKPKGA